LYCKIQHVSSENFFQNSFPIIIIDAGHGGEDGGAVAVDGTLEKNINLDISLKLRDIISVYGYKTKLIRQTDTDLHTEGDTIRQRKISDINHRLDIMKSYDNCLYVSVHQNKFNDSRIHGAQTFYSPNNYESKNLANFIQNSISYQLQRDNKRTIKIAGTGIFLLYNATKPTVMVECGFISNTNELKNLKNYDYQKQMALSIAFGIINYNISEVKNGSEV
jgi:N-acetylmuramoyl-L-alanine amidase